MIAWKTKFFILFTSLINIEQIKHPEWIWIYSTRNFLFTFNLEVFYFLRSCLDKSNILLRVNKKFSLPKLVYSYISKKIQKSQCKMTLWRPIQTSNYSLYGQWFLGVKLQCFLVVQNVNTRTYLRLQIEGYSHYPICNLSSKSFFLL